MEKLLLKKIGLIFVSLLVIIFTIFAVIIFSVERKNSIHSVNEMVEQVENTYNKNKQVSEESIKLLEDDYLNRAYAIEFMLSDNPQKNYNNESLKNIKKFMEVEFINVINSKGNIVFSSDENKVGLSLKDYEKSKEFYQLIASDDPKDYCIYFEEKSTANEKSRIYVGVKSQSEDYAIVQIGVKSSLLDNFTRETVLNNLFDSIPTTYEVALFAVNKESGEIEGITRNNESSINIEGITEKEAFLNALKSYEEGILVNINGTKKFIKTIEVDDVIIGGYLEARSVYKAVILEFIFIFFGIVIVLFTILVIVQYSIKKYILQDLENIEKNVKELINGNYDVTFQTNYDTEFGAISKVLNDWKKSYRYKTERMTRIISCINSHIGVFECLYPINQTFFSGNMQTILGVSTEEWHHISKTPYEFENYINGCLGLLDEEEGVISLNHRYISIVSFREKDEFYGMIIDRTGEMKEKEKIQHELHEIQVESETDGLTRVLNRTGVEKRVKNALCMEPKSGVMLIFDLDNFKSINDNRGHLEGDEVLKKFSLCLKREFRTNDIVGRIGGDEFIVFVHEALEEECLVRKLDSLLTDIRDTLGEYYKIYSLSTSIGVVLVDERIHSYKQLYQEADEALYHAKALGKDQFYIKSKNEGI